MLKLSLQMVNMNGHSEPPLPTSRHPLASQPWSLLRFTQGFVEAVPSACKSTHPSSCSHSLHPSGLSSQVTSPAPITARSPRSSSDSRPGPSLRSPLRSLSGFAEGANQVGGSRKHTTGGPQTFAGISWEFSPTSCSFCRGLQALPPS